MAIALEPDPVAWEFARAIPAPITVRVYSDRRAVLLDGMAQPRMVRRTNGRVTPYSQTSAGHCSGSGPCTSANLKTALAMASR
jgi:hypothetical protein